MKTNTITLTAFYLLCVCASAFAKLPPTKDRVVKPDPAAAEAATAFLSKIDTRSYHSAYEQLTPRVRPGGASGEERVVSYLRTRREPLGSVLSRSLSRARFSKTIAGGPDGAYEFLDYETVFARKAHGIEVVTLTKESGHWEISGYHVF